MTLIRLQKQGIANSCYLPVIVYHRHRLALTAEGIDMF